MDKNIIRGFGIATGTDTYAVTLSVKDAAYVTGGLYIVSFTNANTGTSTLNVNALGAKNVKDQAGVNILAGAIDAASTLVLIYDGTEFQLQNGIGNTDFASQAETDAGTTAVKSIAPNTLAIGRQKNNAVSGTLAAADTKTTVLIPTISGYTANQLLTFQNTTANTGAVTINIDGVGAKAIVTTLGDALIGGEMPATSQVVLAYNAINDNFTLVTTVAPYQVGAGANSVQLIGDNTNAATADYSGSLSGEDNDITTGEHNVIAGGENNTINPGTAADSHNAILGGIDHNMGTPVQTTSIIGGQGHISAAAIYTGAGAETDVYDAIAYGLYAKLDRPGALVHGSGGAATEGSRMLSTIIMGKGVTVANTDRFLRVSRTADVAANEGLPMPTAEDCSCLMRIETVISVEDGTGVAEHGNIFMSVDYLAVKCIAGTASIVSQQNLFQTEQITGTVDLTGGGAGSVDGITVDGIQIMSGAEAFDTDLSTTAANVAANINAFTSAPNYSATSSGTTVKITGTDITSGFTVVSATTTITTADVNGVYVVKPNEFNIDANSNLIRVYFQTTETSRRDATSTFTFTESRFALEA